jgi:putative MATE family efflux protein
MENTKKRVGTNLTEGNIWKVLLTFAVPVILTNVIQQLYSMVDLIIAGKFIGAAGTIGVSTGGELSDFLTPVAVALGSAGQIYIAQLVGAKKDKQVKDTIGTLLSICMIISIVMMVLSIGLCDVFLNMMNCPEEGFNQARAYLIITAIGLPFIFGYNAICGILRGMGESKRPLIFIIVAASVNIVTDVIFVVVFKLEAAGTAIATVLSQIGSCLAAFWFMYKRKESFGFELKLSFLKIHGYAAKTIVRLAIPQIARTLLVRFSMLYVNSNCNAFGATYAQTNSIGNKIQKFLEVFIQGIDTAAASIIGQNLGARKNDRASKTVWNTLWLCIGVAAVATIISLIIPKQLFGLFTNESAVIELGVTFLRIMIAHYFCSAFVGAFQSMVTGCGFVELGFAIGILDGVICKIGLSIIFLKLGVGETSYWWGTALSRFLPGVLCMIYFYSGKWKTRKMLSDREA